MSESFDYSSFNREVQKRTEQRESLDEEQMLSYLKIYWNLYKKSEIEEYLRSQKLPVKNFSTNKEVHLFFLRKLIDFNDPQQSYIGSFSDESGVRLFGWVFNYNNYMDQSQ